MVKTFSPPGSPHTARKRLSLASSETASSVDSSGSSGVHDLNLQAADEEAPPVHSFISTPLEEKLSNAVKRSKQRKLSRETSPLAHANIIETLDENVALKSKEKSSDRRRSVSLEEKVEFKYGKERSTSLEEDGKGNSFGIKSVPFLGKLTQRDKSNSVVGDAMCDSPVVLRRNLKDRDSNNTAPRRRSFIDRISMKSHIDSLTKRRNSLEIPSPRNGKGSETEDRRLKSPRKEGGISTEVWISFHCFSFHHFIFNNTRNREIIEDAKTESILMREETGVPGENPRRPVDRLKAQPTYNTCCRGGRRDWWPLRQPDSSRGAARDISQMLTVQLWTPFNRAQIPWTGGNRCFPLVKAVLHFRFWTSRKSSHLDDDDYYFSGLLWSARVLKVFFF